MRSFDFSNDTFDFRNLSRLIYQMALLISKICRFWFIKWHFWFPKLVSFDFSNDTFDFQNLSRLISQMAFLISKMRLIWILSTWQFLWVVRPTQGRGDTQSMVTTRPNEAAKVFWWKMGMCRRIGFGFPKGGFVLSVLNRDIYLWRQESNHIFTWSGYTVWRKKKITLLSLSEDFGHGEAMWYVKFYCGSSVTNLSGDFSHSRTKRHFGEI